MRDELARSLQVLSAMITPAILILASSSIMTTTVSRLAGIINRARESADAHARVVQAEEPGEAIDVEVSTMFRQVQAFTRRSRVLQVAFIGLNLAVTSFVSSVVFIGFAAFTDADAVGWAPIAFGILGALLMLAMVNVLIYDSVIGFRTVDEEMDLIVMLSHMRAAHAEAAVCEETDTPRGESGGGEEAF